MSKVRTPAVVTYHGTSSLEMTARRRVGVLVRISEDKAGDEAGVGRQEKDCQAAAGRQDWDVAAVYCENDTSAFKRRRIALPDGTTAMRVVRPAFRQMLDDLGAGAIDGLVAYNLDRVARDPRDLEDLIDVVEEKKVPTYAVTGLLDLSSDAGITNARIMCAIANQSSRDTSRRQARKQQELAEQGRYAGGGKRPFGYESDGITVRPHEARLVKEMCRRLLKGESVASLTRYLDTTGVKPALSDRWNRRSIHALLKSPRIAGLRTYKGDVVAEAQWPAIVSLDTWEQVNAQFAARATGGTNRLRWWLTNVLICSQCSRGLSSGTGANGGRYWCSTTRGGCGRIATNLPKTELAVETMLKTYLSRPDVLTILRATRGAASVDKARRAAQADEKQLAELATMWANREITRAEFQVARGPIAERLANAEDLIKASLPAALRELTRGDVDRRWTHFSPAEKREVAQAIWPSGILVLPSRRSGFKGWDEARLVPTDWLAGE